MSRYASYGSLDDRIAQDGDVGFVGFNNRLRPDQLQAGMLADAQNIRMDRNGQAQVRKGVDLVNAPLSVSLSALTLPFFMGGNVNAGSFVTSRKYSIVAFQTGTGAATDFKDLGATYANEKTASSPVATANTLTITVTGHGRSVGDEVILASSSNGSTAFTAASSSTNIDGARTVATVADANTLSFTITGITNGETINTTNPRVYDSKTYEFTATGAGNGSTTGVATSEELTVTATPDSGTLDITSTNAFTNFPSSGTINLSDVDTSVISPDPNGDRAFTKVSASEIQVSDQSYSGSADASVTLKFGILNDGVVNNIYGSTDFSDPNQASTQYIVLGSNAKAVGIDIASGTTFDMGYPSLFTISASADMIQAFNKVFIFQGGSTALENNLRISTINAAAVVASDNLVTITTSSNHNLSTGDLVSISGVLGAGTDGAFTSLDPNGLSKTITKTSDTQFTYALTTSSDETYTVSSSSIVATDFTKVASGTYTQPVPLSLTDIDYASGIGTATASTAAIATLLVGDTLTFTDVGSSTYSVNDTIVVSSIPSTTTFTFATDKADLTNKNGTVQKRVSVGLGFSHMPAPSFATYHQRRLVMPFQFSVDASSNSFTTRNIQDEIIASDILDTDTYDQVYAQYRFNAGTSDFVVGLHSFAEDRLLVFNRNSIHIVANTTDLQSASTQVLTDEVGCVARKSIEQVGNQVIFLSDNGVYGTQFLDEYNLRGTETPLSEPINETIGRINKNAQENAVAVYFDNRYYIAVPLDSSSNNNAILIYNFLNKQWESIDAVNDANYHISNLLVLGDGDKRGVYAVNDIGGVHRLDHRVDGVDRVSTQIGGTEQSLQIAGALTTRQYTFGTLDRKRWKEFDVHIQSSDTNTSDLDINIETENPDFPRPNTDDSGLIGALTDFNDGVLDIGEDVSIRGRIGNRRGYGIQFTFNNTVGRPIIRAIEVEGATTMRSTNKAE